MPSNAFAHLIQLHMHTSYGFDVGRRLYVKRHLTSPSNSQTAAGDFAPPMRQITSKNAFGLHGGRPHTPKALKSDGVALLQNPRHHVPRYQLPRLVEVVVHDRARIDAEAVIDRGQQVDRVDRAVER